MKVVWERLAGLLAAIRRKVALRTRLRAAATWIADQFRRVPRVRGPWTRAEDLLAHLGVVRPVSVIVVVAPDDTTETLRRSLGSLLDNTRTGGVSLTIVDDASRTDASVAQILDGLSEVEVVSVLRDENGAGQRLPVDRVIAETGGDVVLMDGSFAVPPRWLDNLICAAYQDPRIATARPLWEGSPELRGWDISTPTHLDHDDVGRIVARAARPRYASVPETHGPPLFIKRAALQAVGSGESTLSGPFDGGTIREWTVSPRWAHVIDASTYLTRVRPEPFGPRDHTMAAGSERLQRAHVHVRSAEDASDLGFPDPSEIGRDIGLALERAELHHERPRPRVLYVLNTTTGGMPQTTFDLMRSVRSQFEPYLLLSDTRALSLCEFDGEGLRAISEWPLRPSVRPDDFHREDYQAIVLTILLEHGIELVHVRHLIGHTFDLPLVADRLEVPVVLSFHDYYYSCPTVHLLDEQLRFCGGRCTTGQGECHISAEWLEGLPHLKHGWVHVWRRHVERMFDHVDAFVTTTTSARDVYRRSFGRFERDPIRIIEHGRDVPGTGRGGEGSRGSDPSAVDRIKIAVPGNLDVHKGSGFVRRIAEVDQDRRIEFHFLGRPDPSLDDVGVQHGEYEREDLVSKLRDLDPTFVGLFSLWAETYSHTLTEAWAAGIPVVATDLGAFRERIRRHGGGWLLDPHDAAGAYQRILEIAGNGEEYRRVRSSISTEEFPKVVEMAEAYVELYRGLLADRSLGGRGSSLRESGRLQVGLVLPGGTGPFFPSTHVRILRRLGHPTVRRDIESSVLTPEEVIRNSAGNLDVVVVQRTAVSPDVVQAFLQELERTRTPLVFDLDDDLMTLTEERPDDPDYGPYAGSIVRVLEAADLVTVSTDVLRERLRTEASRVEVVPNHLDEHLWFQHPDGQSSVPDRDESIFRLLYMGSPTHSDDLEILRPVMRDLSRHGFELELAGVTIDRPWGTWWRRAGLPDGATAYPAFVQWLRRAAGRWDAAVAPLRDTLFNRAKSDLKFLEYAAIGTPGVYSDVGPYRTVDDRVTGLVVPNEPEAWIQALTELKRDQTLRETIANEARSYVREARSLGSGRNLEEYAALLRSVAAASS